MRTYPIICPSCNGTGRVLEIGISTNTSKQCPACRGTGCVTCIESN